MPRVRTYFGTVTRIREHSETIFVLLDGRVTSLALHHKYVDLDRTAAQNSTSK